MSYRPALPRRCIVKAALAAGLGLLLSGCGPEEDPSDTPLDRLARLRHELPEQEYREAVVTWATAHAAVAFGQTAGLHLSPKMLHHWLHGQGQPLDITGDLLRAIDPSSPDRGGGASPAAVDYLSASLSRAIGDSLWFSGRPFWLADHLGEFDNTHEISADRDLNRDVHLGLGTYGLRLRGYSERQGSTVHVVPRAPLQVFDTYEWINETCERVGPFELCQSDMRRLGGYGLGHDYRVSASLDLSGQHLVVVPAGREHPDGRRFRIPHWTL